MESLRQDLRSYIESHYPILYLVTFEEEKYDCLIRDLGDDRRILEWNMARGCVDFSTKARRTGCRSETDPSSGPFARKRHHVVGNVDFSPVGP